MRGRWHAWQAMSGRTLITTTHRAPSPFPAMRALQSAALSSSYAPFEAQLEGCILQHTAAVDLYLQSAPAASTWAAPPRASLSGATSKRELYDLFQADMASTMWQAFVAPHHGEPFHLEVRVHA